MKYQQIAVGRSFVLKMDHEENLLNSLKQFVFNEKIKGAVFWVLGAMQAGDLVHGPQKPTLPPVPILSGLSGVHEVVGFGNISFNEADEIKIHLHLGLGRDQDAKVGCLRDHGEVFLTCELFVMELTPGLKRSLDPVCQLDLLNFEGGISI